MAYSSPDPDCDIDSLFEEGSLWDDMESPPLSTGAIDSTSPPDFDHHEHTAQLSSLSRPQEAVTNNFGLTFPVVPTEQVQSSEPPALTMPQLTLPIVPEPSGAFSVPRDGHTSGDNVVSLQSFHHSDGIAGPVSDGPGPDDQIDEAELADLYETLGEAVQVVDAEAEMRATSAPRTVSAHQPAAPAELVLSNRSGNDDERVLVSNIPGFRYAGSKTHRGNSLPQRVDTLEGAMAIVPYMTLRRGTKPEDIFRWLELTPLAGNILRDEIKLFLKTPWAHQLVHHDSRGDDTKRVLVTLSWRLLVDEGLGLKYFGHNPGSARQKIWPQDSTFLLATFALQVYREYSNKRSNDPRRNKRHAERAEVSSSNSGTRSPSAAAPSPAMSGGTAEDPIVIDDSPSDVSNTAASALGADNSANAAVDAHPAASSNGAVASGNDISARVAVAAQTAASNAAAASSGPNISTSVAVTAHTVVFNKVRLELQSAVDFYQFPIFNIAVPEDAEMKYRFSFHSVQQRNIMQPAVFRHADRFTLSMLDHNLRGWATTPSYVAHTPVGSVKIGQQTDWDRAVAIMYAKEPTGTMDVDVYLS